MLWRCRSAVSGIPKINFTIVLASDPLQPFKTYWSDICWCVAIRNLLMSICSGSVSRSRHLSPLWYSMSLMRWHAVLNFIFLDSTESSVVFDMTQFRVAAASSAIITNGNDTFYILIYSTSYDNVVFDNWKRVLGLIPLKQRAASFSNMART